MKKIIFGITVTVFFLSSCSTLFNVESYDECIEKWGTEINSYPKICEYNGYYHSDQSDEYGMKTWSAVCEELWGISGTTDNVNYFCEINGTKTPELEMMKNYYNSFKESLPPTEMIKNNIQNTDLSALVNLNSCENISNDNDAESISYKWLKCSATIMSVYKGDYKSGDKINLYYADHSWKTIDYTDKQLLISANSTVAETNTFIEPDVAHIFDYSNELEKIFTDASK